MKNKIFKLFGLGLLSTLTIGCSGVHYEEGEKVLYSFTFKAQNGMPLMNSEVTFKKNGKTVAKGVSDGEGVASVYASEGEYQISYNLPKGYKTEAETVTTLNDFDYEVPCTSFVIDEEAPKEYFYDSQTEDKKKYEIYDIMYDFSFSIYDKDGENATKLQDVRLSSILKEKKMVLLNFWYTTCSWCLKEFPDVSDAYDDYSDRVEIIALDYYDRAKDVYEFKNNYGYNFTMSYDYVKLTNAFEISAFPTSFVIDRYGMIVYSCNTFTSYNDVATLFEKYGGDDYIPTYKEDINAPDTPDVEGPSMSAIASTVNGEGCNATYHTETNEEDAKYNWPWIINESENAIQPSNAGHDNSYSILYMNIHMKEDEVLAFDYKSSSEASGDVLYILAIGDNESRIIRKISGVDQDYSLCELFVSNMEADYEFGFIFMKDSTSMDGDDTVYIRNMRTYSVDDIVYPTYVLRSAAYGGFNASKGKFNNYITPVLNEEDGYYHVNEKDGQLLLADLLGTTNFDNESTVYTMISTYNMIDNNGQSINDVLMKYCTLAGNTLKGYVPVTEELKTYLFKYVEIRLSNSDNSYPIYDEEWLELCYYFENYGTDEKFSDPTVGLSGDTAVTAHLGEENYATFDRTLIPRGIKFVFTAEVAGVYHFYAVGDTSSGGSHAWYFDENGKQFYESNFDERMRYFAVEDQYEAMNTFHDYVYLSEGQTIYINVGFEDIYYYSTLQWGIEYSGESVDIFRYCSPGYYTSKIDENGEITGEIISTGINAKLCSDGYYHHILKDGSEGSIVYADFTYATPLLEYSILECLNNKNIRDEDGNNPFDFTCVGDRDRTSDFKNYLSKISTSSSPHGGCVPVDKNLKDLLQLISAKYGFDAEGGWQKLCYYYAPINSSNPY